MQDITCAVCLEPWYAPNKHDADMKHWEFELFRRGLGCPCCEGIPPDGIDKDEAADEFLRSSNIMGGTDDPDSFFPDNYFKTGEANAPKVRWLPPPDEVMFKCSECVTTIKKCGDDGVYYYDCVTPYHVSRITDAETYITDYVFTTDSGAKVCTNCYTNCEKCHAKVLYSADTYAPHSGIPINYGNATVCMDCAEQMCLECEEAYEDCECKQDD
jgi:hypothetical protein